MRADAALRVEGLGKKFCLSLRRSMWYGVRDLVAGALPGVRTGVRELRRDEFWSLRDVGFEVAPGECLAVMGANGAGKSTLLKLLSGILRPDRGRIEVRGRVGSLVEVGAGFHPMLTGRENIYVNGAILGMGRREIDAKFDAIVDFAEIGAFLDTPVKFYSSGMYVRLGFAVAAHTEPDVLLVDEVLAVGDLSFRMRCFERVRELRERGAAILVVSHNLHDLARVAQRALVLEAGEARHLGDLDTGVVCYQAILHERSERVAPSRPRSTSRIESAQVVDRDGAPRQTIQTGDEVCLDIEIESSVPVKDARLIASIESVEAGVLGSFSTAWSDFAFDLSTEGTRLRLVLPALPLLRGAYAINLSLYGAGPENVLDRLRRAARLDVAGPVSRPGFGASHSVLFEHRWERLS